MNQKIFTYYMPVKVFFGVGELEKVGSLTKELGDKALLVKLPTFSNSPTPKKTLTGI